MTQQKTTANSFYNHKNGLIGEEKAKRFIYKKGYKILQERYKTHYGEIDIIAQQPYLRQNILKNGFSFKSYKKRLVFIEVKSRKNDELIESILRNSQIQRIKNSALYFLAQNPEYENHDIRFDFILINKCGEITHFEEYF